MILELWARHLIILFQTTSPQNPLAGCHFPLSLTCPIIVMAERSPLFDIINEKNRTLDEEFGTLKTFLQDLVPLPPSNSRINLHLRLLPSWKKMCRTQKVIYGRTAGQNRSAEMN